MTPPTTSLHIEVRGIVQGVGFRPFVHALATEHGLTGTVGNSSTMVTIEVAGPTQSTAAFVEQLQTRAPALAHIDSVDVVATHPTNGSGDGALDDFRIIASVGTGGERTLISPDAAACAECVSELLDPSNRRYGHPFITCTNCGPRLTIIADLPYDRANTTMAQFEMCAVCASEYTNPSDRRYHAQPIGCHDCGPVVRFGTDAKDLTTGDPITRAAREISRGAIVAVKGIGGYHLFADATNPDALASLRRRKHRPDKPFALLVKTVAEARQLVDLTATETAELTGPAAPIVLAKRNGDDLPSLVAPASPLLGVMLAYTPVHHLLLEQLGRPIVVTSANPPGAPLAHTTEQILELSHLYDALLDHDRPIRVPVDDSVVRLIDDAVVPIRRARGFAPIPVRSAPGTQAVLAVGGELKNTFCLGSGNRAWVSPHIGDMENLETLQAFEKMVGEFTTMYQIEPKVVAVDAHPGYLSSKWARRTFDIPILDVQHHHAHVAAVMAEHQLDPTMPVIGFAFDGTGYGTDGTIWGGEVLVATASFFERTHHLQPIALPGGDAAVRNPNRVALAHLAAAGIDWADGLAPLDPLSPGERDLLAQQLERNVACVPTSSMGRLFDAVASLLDLRHQISYEAQAAIELEILADQASERSCSYAFARTANGTFDPGPVLRDLLEDQQQGQPIAEIAFGFHAAVADLVHDISTELARSKGLDTVVLSGGVFQNGVLLSLCTQRLASNFEVYTHQRVPANDGGLSLGQAFIAAHSTHAHSHSSTTIAEV